MSSNRFLAPVPSIMGEIMFVAPESDGDFPLELRPLPILFSAGDCWRSRVFRQTIKLPQGYRLEYGGQFESQEQLTVACWSSASA